MIARGGDIDRRVYRSRRGNELEIGKALNDIAGQRCSLAYDVDHIERQEALDNLEGMLSVPGVDVACLGYMDLSVDLGVPGQLSHPSMVAGVEKMIAVARKNGVAAGIIAPNLEDIAHWIKRGMRFVSHATDGIYLQQAATAAVQRLRTFGV